MSPSLAPHRSGAGSPGRVRGSARVRTGRGRPAGPPIRRSRVGRGGSGPHPDGGGRRRRAFRPVPWSTFGEGRGDGLHHVGPTEGRLLSGEPCDGREPSSEDRCPASGTVTSWLRWSTAATVSRVSPTSRLVPATSTLSSSSDWSRFGARVASAMTSLLAGVSAQSWDVRQASICWRRRENSMIWSRVNPSMSAMPLRTGCQRTPSRSVSSAAEFGFVEVAGGLLVPVQEPAVQGPPHAVDAFDPVGDDDVGVELGVVLSAGELGEPGGHVPVGVDRPGLDSAPRGARRSSSTGSPSSSRTGTRAAPRVDDATDSR